MQRESRCRILLYPPVSILIRSSDRMQPQQIATDLRALPRFNPHPIIRPDAAVGSPHVSVSAPLFQSSSDHQTGCSRRSIRSWGLTQQFQSSSDHQTGCSPRLPACVQPPQRFNPHPIIRPDAACTRQTAQGSAQRFNPHPIIRPDAAIAYHAARSGFASFNPHPIIRPDAAIQAVTRAFSMGLQTFRANQPHVSTRYRVRASLRMRKSRNIKWRERVRKEGPATVSRRSPRTLRHRITGPSKSRTNCRPQCSRFFSKGSPIR